MKKNIAIILLILTSIFSLAYAAYRDDWADRVQLMAVKAKEESIKYAKIADEQRQLANEAITETKILKEQILKLKENCKKSM